MCPMDAVQAQQQSSGIGMLQWRKAGYSLLTLYAPEVGPHPD